MASWSPSQSRVPIRARNFVCGNCWLSRASSSALTWLTYIVWSGSRAPRSASIHAMTSSTASVPSVRSSGRWIAKPSRRTSSIALPRAWRSLRVTPCRFIEDMTSIITRAPTRARTPSTEETERITRSGSGTGSSPRRKGVRTSRSPLNQSLIRAASYVVPTASMSEPNRVASSASRSWPKP
ncbi:hypothetical protein GA0115246_101734 [Streptomyces sp. SolWspMP-sol7th]|nr:hypothetical protein GA0115246_101734 [Streptomyces sp. SolWspMP-sol7th]